MIYRYYQDNWFHKDIFPSIFLINDCIQPFGFNDICGPAFFASFNARSTKISLLNRMIWFRNLVQFKLCTNNWKSRTILSDTNVC